MERSQLTVVERDHPLGIGIIGVGDHAERGHVQHLTDMPELCRITALADINHQKLETVARRHNIADAAMYSNWEDLLTDDSVEAVMIMTPDRFHIPQLAGAVAVGKHVLCEKPLASNWHELYQLGTILEQADQDGVMVTTCHPRRFDPPFMEARHYLTNPQAVLHDFGVSRELGEPKYIKFRFDYPKPTKTGLHTSLMFDHLNHEVDLMNYLFGFSVLAGAYLGLDGETAFWVTGKRRDDIGFNVQGVRHLKEKVYKEYMAIDCENGVLTMDMLDGVAGVIMDGRHRQLTDPSFKTSYQERFSALNRNFLRSIAGVEAPYLTAAEMLVNNHAAIALYEPKPRILGRLPVILSRILPIAEV